jgi:FixJ family two-component response regulator
MCAQKAVIYVVEDDPSFRRSMERLIRACGFEAVAYSSAESFLKQKRIRHPACLVLDVQLPGIDGLTLQEELNKCNFTLPVIFLTGYGNVPMSVRAMKQGAAEFLQKPFEARQLQAAVRQAVASDRLKMRQEARQSKIHALIKTLTPREREVFSWVITGKLNKQIARALGTAEKTVKIHRGRVMQKLCVSSVAELVRLAENAGIAPAA